MDSLSKKSIVKDKTFDRDFYSAIDNVFAFGVFFLDVVVDTNTMGK